MLLEMFRKLRIKRQQQTLTRIQRNELPYTIDGNINTYRIISSHHIHLQITQSLSFHQDHFNRCIYPALTTLVFFKLLKHIQVFAFFFFFNVQPLNLLNSWKDILFTYLILDPYHFFQSYHLLMGSNINIFNFLYIQGFLEKQTNKLTNSHWNSDQALKVKR